MVDVAIVGGGLAGLAAAWYAQERGLSYVLLEREAKPGGKAQSEQVWGYGDSPFTVEYGPDGILTRKPWALELAQAVGTDYVSLKPLPKRIYVLNSGELHPIPDGLHLLVPTKPLPFLRSGLFSWRGKLRMLAEPFIPPRSADTDESLANFIRRRLGAEALDKLGEPMLAGVYNADAERMSINATFGMFPALEREHGSLLRGMWAKSRERGSNNVVPLVSMRDGMGALAERVAAKLTGNVRCNASVREIKRSGAGYHLHVNDVIVDAKSVVITTPASVAALLLGNIAPEASALLNRIRYEGVGSMSVAYRSADMPHPLDAYGVVIPRSEGRRIDGVTFASAKWENRAPEGYHLLRVFFGGPNTRNMLDKDSDTILEYVRAELRDLLGITAEPLFYRERRWKAGYPQYDVGHRERVNAIRDALPPNIFIAGLSYDGVGVPDTVRGARDTVRNIEFAGARLEA